MIKLGYSCSEDYNLMEKKGCSRFCTSCKTLVYDFRGKTEVEINEIKNENPSIKCGIFTTIQAEEDARSKVNWVFKMAFAAVFVFGFNVNTLFAQDTTKCQHSDLIKVKKMEDSNEIQVIGKVVVHEATPVEGVKVYYDNGDQRVAVTTDKEGRFVLKISDEFFGQMVTIHFSHSFYYTQNFTINSAELKHYELEVNMEEEEMLLGIMLPPDDFDE